QREIVRDPFVKTIRPKAYDISLMDAYTPHAATPSPENAERTFFSITFSPYKFDRTEPDGLVINNPMFKNEPGYPWPRAPRPISESLVRVHAADSVSIPKGIERSLSNAPDFGDLYKFVAKIPDAHVETVFGNIRRIVDLKKTV